jgi:hypothetical protein
LNDPSEPTPRFGEHAVKLLGLLVGLVDGAIEVSMHQLTRRPALKIIVQGLQDLPPATILIGID